MSIESDAQRDLSLDDGDAEDVVGGKKVTKKKKGGHPAPKQPIMIKQMGSLGPVEVSANSGDDDCAPDYGGDPSSTDSSA